MALNQEIRLKRYFHRALLLRFSKWINNLGHSKVKKWTYNMGGREYLLVVIIRLAVRYNYLGLIIRLVKSN